MRIIIKIKKINLHLTKQTHWDLKKWPPKKEQMQAVHKVGIQKNKLLRNCPDTSRPNRSLNGCTSFCSSGSWELPRVDGRRYHKRGIERAGTVVRVVLKNCANMAPFTPSGVPMVLDAGWGGTEMKLSRVVVDLKHNWSVLFGGRGREKVKDPFLKIQTHPALHILLLFHEYPMPPLGLDPPALAPPKDRRCPQQTVPRKQKKLVKCKILFARQCTVHVAMID